MKKFILIVSALLMLNGSSFAQNNTTLNINHKLGDADFAMETAATNNLNNNFKVTRLEYYISEITIVHDGGVETLFDNIWVLVDASEATQIDLGDSNINAVEMVKLHIGVQEEYNHLDPSSYASSHPLAPQNPSMHWGWTSGYRFIAFEGFGGSDLNRRFELHGLEDANYFTTEIPLTTTANNNEVIINIDADYTRALEDINVDGEVIVHGGYGAAKKCLQNFRDYVFSPASIVSSMIDFSEVNKFEVFPNPANGTATISLETTKEEDYKVSVTNIIGQQVLFFEIVNGNSMLNVELKEAGFYFINLIKDGQPIITKKLISK